MKTEKTLITLNKFFQYIPVVSTLTSAVNAAIKYIFVEKKGEYQGHNLYYRHLHELSGVRLVVLSIPVIGNIVVGLIDLSKRKHHNKAFMHRAIAEEGANLYLASPELKRDKELVLEAYGNDRRSIHYADQTLLEDKEFVLNLLKFPSNKADAQFLFGLIGKEQREDRDIILAAVKKNGMLLRYAPEALWGDEEIVRAAFENDPSSIQYAVGDAKKRIQRSLSPNDPRYIYSKVPDRGAQTKAEDYVTPQEYFNAMSDSNRKDSDTGEITETVLPVEETGISLNLHEEPQTTEMSDSIGTSETQVRISSDDEIAIHEEDENPISSDSDTLEESADQSEEPTPLNSVIFHLEEISDVVGNPHEIDDIFSILEEEKFGQKGAADKLIHDEHIMPSLHEQYYLQQQFAVREVNPGFEMYEDWGNRDFVMSKVQKSGSYLQFASDELKKDRDIVLVAVTNDGNALRHAHKMFLDDEGFVEIAMQTERSIYYYASPKIREIPKIKKLYQNS